MWTTSLTLHFLLVSCFLLRVHSQEILVLDDSDVDFNATANDVLRRVKQPLPVWTNQQMIVCLLSVSLGTLLFLITFIVPAMIIVRRTRREKHRLDLRELRRMSDFM